MALCKNFDCLKRSIGFCRNGGEGCESVCLDALYIYKCNACKNKPTCQGSELWNEMQAIKESVQNEWRSSWNSKANQ